jgi:hypothetical protein
MYFNDPSLYAVTPREINTPFTGGYPFAWGNVQRFINPYQAYGLQHCLPYGMQQYGMQHFYPTVEKYGVPFGAQQFVPPMFGYGYGTPPWMMQGNSFGMPFVPTLQSWQRPFWY